MNSFSRMLIVHSWNLPDRSLPGTPSWLARSFYALLSWVAPFSAWPGSRKSFASSWSAMFWQSKWSAQLRPSYSDSPQWSGCSSSLCLLFLFGSYSRVGASTASPSHCYSFSHSALASAGRIWSIGHPRSLSSRCLFLAAASHLCRC